MVRFTPYEGKKPYIFTSYSRENTERMLCTMNDLREREYRVWYDEGIPGGNDWPLFIAQHLNASQAVVFFLSGPSLVSPNCFSEMKAAAMQKKTVICVPLDDSARLVRAAVREHRGLTETELRNIKAATEEYAKKRRAGVGLPEPGKWTEVLAAAVFPEDTADDAPLADGILRTGCISDDFKGSYETDGGGNNGFNRWLIAIIACVAVLAGLSYKGVQVYQSYAYKEPTATAAAVVATPRPTLDPAQVPEFLNSAITFPKDGEQERAVRQALDHAEGDIEDSRLAEITSLCFCGKTVLQSANAIRYENGRWLANGAPVGQGEITDLSLIKTMYYIEELSLVYQKVTSAEDLKDLQVLLSLDLSGNPIESLDLSEGFKGLETLNISHTGIRSLVSNSYPASLKTVYVSADMLPLELPSEAPFEVVLTR